MLYIPALLISIMEEVRNDDFEEVSDGEELIDQLSSTLRNFNPEVPSARRRGRGRPFSRSQPSNRKTRSGDNTSQLILDMVTKITSDVESVVKKLDRLSAQVELSNARIKTLEKSVDSISKEKVALTKRVVILEARIDDFEQAKLNLDVVVFGRNFNTGEEGAKQTMTSFLTDSLEIAPAEVSCMKMSRFGKGTQSWLIRMPSLDVKKSAFKRFRTMKPAGVFINELLIPRRKKLFTDLLRMKSEGSISGVFSVGGRIFVRRSEGAGAQRVDDVSQLRQMTT